MPKQATQSPAIRSAAWSDYRAVEEILNGAFGRDQEASLVQRLRDDGDAEIEAVACIGDKPVGHIMLSRMQSPEGALGLAPVAVAPHHQRRGIGTALIQHALERARLAGWRLVFVLGEPDYYGRFGFDVGKASTIASPYAGPYFAVCELGANGIAGVKCAEYARAFSALSD